MAETQSPMQEASGNAGQDDAAAPLPQLQQVEVTVSVRLGRATLTLDEVAALGEHSLVELDREVGEPVDILVNGRLVARGEVVTLAENFGVRVTEIVG